MIDMACSDGMCLIDGRDVDSNCPDDCSECEVYKKFKAEQNVHAGGDK